MFTRDALESVSFIVDMIAFVIWAVGAVSRALYGIFSSFIR